MRGNKTVPELFEEIEKTEEECNQEWFIKESMAFYEQGKPVNGNLLQFVRKQVMRKEVSEEWIRETLPVVWRDYIKLEEENQQIVERNKFLFLQGAMTFYNTNAQLVDSPGLFEFVKSQLSNKKVSDQLVCRALPLVWRDFLKEQNEVLKKTKPQNTVNLEGEQKDEFRELVNNKSQYRMMVGRGHAV